MVGDFRLLYLPDAMFLVVHVITIDLRSMDARQVKTTWAETVKKVTPAVVVLLFATATVQIALQSGDVTGTDSMLIILSEGMTDIAGGVYPLLAAFVGVFDAFLAGSGTVSDVLFGTSQYGVVDQIDTSETVMLGTQTVGGVIGNLITVHDVATALTVIGLIGKEGRVIRLGLIPLLYYETAVGAPTLPFSCVLFPGVSWLVGSRLGAT